MNRDEWLTLFIGYRYPEEHAPKELDPLRLQKGMFLFWQAAKLPDPEAYEFRADDYGPCSPQLYFDLDRLEEQGLLSSRAAAGKRFSYYSATDAGRDKASALSRRSAAKRYLPYLDVIHGLLQQLSFSEIVSGVYAAYPAFSMASVAPDRLPDGERGARDSTAVLFRPQEIRDRADTLVGMRQIGNGEYVTRRNLRSLLHGA